MYYYVFRMDHHMFYQGVEGRPTTQKSKAVGMLRKYAKTAGLEQSVVVGRVLWQNSYTLYPAAVIVASDVFTTSLCDDADVAGGDGESEGEGDQDQVLQSFDAAVNDIKLLMRISWIKEWGAESESESETESESESE
jgi:hypothetical protein